MIKLQSETFEAYEVTVAMEGPIETYALNFLKIFNTVKCQGTLIRVTNDYKNNVSVVCTLDDLDATKEYLSNFGAVTSVDKVICVQYAEEPSYDFDKYADIVVVPYIS